MDGAMAIAAAEAEADPEHFVLSVAVLEDPSYSLRIPYLC